MQGTKSTKLGENVRDMQQSTSEKLSETKEPVGMGNRNLQNQNSQYYYCVLNFSKSLESDAQKKNKDFLNAYFFNFFLPLRSVRKKTNLKLLRSES